MGHTEGPWSVDMRRPITVHSEDGAQIADCGQFLYHTKSEERLEANAHLIAAAPDMYEAIERFVAGIEKHADDDLLKRLDFHLRQMRAAIAAAKGVKP